MCAGNNNNGVTCGLSPGLSNGSKNIFSQLFDSIASGVPGRLPSMAADDGVALKQTVTVKRRKRAILLITAASFLPD
ncbi:hypothetical protein [Geotalea toluenoxydans]|uniref:hypothetical protein n=1 Tax=Geotalea toluenoxydans TaxID=421624 RepID=UPI001FB3E7CE|nr:hypothetical protein [Geotalea toluenoxydans]